MTARVPLSLRFAGGQACSRTDVRWCCARAPSQLRFAARDPHRAARARRSLAVLLATVLSYAVARSVTRPLGAITAAMRDMAATGDLTRKIALAGRAGGRTRTRGCSPRPSTRSPTRLRGSSGRRRNANGCSSLGRLSTVIAHEVRNPLMIIKAALRSLGSPRRRRPELREAAADIDEQVVPPQPHRATTCSTSPGRSASSSRRPT